MEPASVDPWNVEGIENLDTARMALRWALEKIRGQERAISDLQKAAEERLSAQTGAERMIKVQRDKIEEQQKYYQSMSRLFELMTRKDFDLAQFARRQVEMESVSKTLDETRRRLEEEWAARRQELEAEHHEMRGRLDAETAALAGAKAALEARQRDFEARSEVWKSEADQREVLAYSSTAQLEARERILEDRRVRLEAEAMRRVERLEEEHRVLREKLHEESRLRVSQAETMAQKAGEELKALQEKFDALSAGRRREDLLEERLQKELKDLEASRRVWEEDRLDRELASRQEQERMRESLSDWREGMEAVLEQRRLDQESEERKRQELWRTREDEFRLREKDWNSRQFKVDSELEEKSRQLEDLKKELLRSIAAYRGRRSLG